MLTRLRTKVSILILLICLPAAAYAQPNEQAVKAAFLVKFLDYVSWPNNTFSNKQSPVQLCILGADPFGGDLSRAAAAATSSGRRIIVRRGVSSAYDTSCHVLFIRGSVSNPVSEILNDVSGRPILTVTDSRQGSVPGTIHFVSNNGRVAFKIDNRRAQRSGLTISSRLLALSVGER